MAWMIDCVNATTAGANQITTKSWPAEVMIAGSDSSIGGDDGWLYGFSTLQLFIVNRSSLNQSFTLKANTEGWPQAKEYNYSLQPWGYKTISITYRDLAELKSQSISWNGESASLSEFIIRRVGSGKYAGGILIGTGRITISTADSPQAAIAVDLDEKGRPIYFNNQCWLPVKLAVHYKDPSKNWQIAGFWEINGNSRKRLIGNSGGDLKSTSSIVEIYAEITSEAHKGYHWSGNSRRVLNGNILNMRETTMSKPSESYYLIDIQCTNLRPKEGEYRWKP